MKENNNSFAKSNAGVMWAAFKISKGNPYVAQLFIDAMEQEKESNLEIEI